MSQDVIQRVQSLSLKYKLLFGLGACLLIAPLTAWLLWGLLGGVALVAAFGIGAAVIAAAPVVSMRLANWQLRAVVAEATANPIETRWNNFRIEESSLANFGNEIERFEAKLVKTLKDLESLERDYPGDPETARFRTYYEDMVRLKELQWQDFERAQSALAEKRRSIEKMERMYAMAKTAQEAGAAAGAKLTFLQEIADRAAIGAADQKVASSMAQLQRRLRERVQERQALPSAAPNVIEGQAIRLPERAGRQS